MMTDSRKHCGVWQRISVSRGGQCFMTPSSLQTTMVSAVGTAAPIASCSPSASTQSAITRCSMSGRAASWSRIPVESAGCLAATWFSALRTESARVLPPSMIALTRSPTSFAASSRAVLSM